MNNKSSFTLAEVLITLTIIGVIAALTIPNLMKKWEDRHTISGLKTAYTIFDNAFKLAVREDGDVRSWLTSKNPNIVAEKLMTYIKVDKYCGSNRNCNQDICTACISYNRRAGGYSYVTNLNGYNSVLADENNHTGGRMLLANGMTASVRIWNYTTSYYGAPPPEMGYASGYGAIVVDINGKKGPNRVGYDIFSLHFNDKGLVAKPNNTYFYTDYQQKCSISQNDTNGDIGRTNGSMCSLWILMKNNVDYKYRDVSAEW